jgi:hypothetical protein
LTISAEEKIESLLRHYEKVAGLEKTDFFIHSQNFNGPTYLDFFYKEKTGQANEIKIVVNKEYVDHPFISLSLCHELGHIENIRRKRNKKFIDPQTTWEWILAEVSADRQAARIYGKPFKKDMVLWLAEKVHLTIKNFGEKKYKSFILKQLIVGIVRLLSALLA